MYADVSPCLLERSSTDRPDSLFKKPSSPIPHARLSPESHLARGERRQIVRSSEEEYHAVPPNQASTARAGDSSPRRPQTVHRPSSLRGCGCESGNLGHSGWQDEGQAYTSLEQQKQDQGRDLSWRTTRQGVQDPEKASSKDPYDRGTSLHSRLRTHHTTVCYDNDGAAGDRSAEKHSLWILVRISSEFSMQTGPLIECRLELSFRPFSFSSPDLFPVYDHHRHNITRTPPIVFLLQGVQTPPGSALLLPLASNPCPARAYPLRA